MRAAAHVHYLGDKYSWPIKSEPRAVGCKDGRLVTVAVYSLPTECIQAAHAAGAGAWCDRVRKARAALRKKAPESHRRAAAANRSRSLKADPEQGNLFGSEHGGNCYA